MSMQQNERSNWPREVKMTSRGRTWPLSCEFDVDERGIIPQDPLNKFNFTTEPAYVKKVKKFTFSIAQREGGEVLEYLFSSLDG